MGVLRYGLTLCFMLVTYYYLRRIFEDKQPLILDGYYHPDFKQLEDVFRQNLLNGKERGGSFAVYHRGMCVFNMWGGYADDEALRPWDRNTLTMAFSASKGIAAIIIAKMVDLGYIDYKRPVADYWPEFGQKDKGNITVELLLSHQAGLPLLDEYLHLRDIVDDPGKVERVLAAQGTVWPAGSEFGYHGVTYGLYVDTLVRKADPKGRDVAQFFREEIAEPFELDTFINTPKNEFYRLARLYTLPMWEMLLETLLSPRYFPILGHYILFPDSLLVNVAKAVVEFTKDMAIFNNPDLREVPLTSATVTSTADGLGKLYGILANGGATENKILLAAEQVQKLATPLVQGTDSVIKQENSIFGPGTGMAKNPKDLSLMSNCDLGQFEYVAGNHNCYQNASGQLMYGHTGHGGQVGMADPTNKLGFMYLTNHISINGLGDDPRYLDLENALYKCLDNFVKNSKINT